jgi:hypothetical protein
MASSKVVKINEFKTKINNHLDFIINHPPTLSGTSKIVGSVALMLQAIILLESGKIMRENKDFEDLQDLVFKYIEHCDDYDIVVFINPTENYKNLLSKGFVRDSKSNVIPTPSDMIDGIKMKYHSSGETLIKMDYLVNDDKKREKPSEYDDKSPDTYEYKNGFEINLEKVEKLQKIYNKTYNENNNNTLLREFKRKDNRNDYISKRKEKTDIKREIFLILKKYYLKNKRTHENNRRNSMSSSTPRKKSKKLSYSHSPPPRLDFNFNGGSKSNMKRKTKKTIARKNKANKANKNNKNKSKKH